MRLPNNLITRSQQTLMLSKTSEFYLSIHFLDSLSNSLWWGIAGTQELEKNTNAYFRLSCLPGEKTAGRVCKVWLDGWRQATGGDPEVYLTVVCL